MDVNANNTNANASANAANAEQKPSYLSRINSFILQSKRVWQVLRKPSSEEFKATAKISALGILAMGAIGFLISDIIKILFK